ncbi:MAG: ATP synthase F1 subunit epsilon [Pseudomonadota bacterium]
MAETIHFALVSPSSKLADAQAEAVTVPAVEGDLTAMANHAPFLSALRPGVITVTGGDKPGRYVVTGGFVEILPTEVGVLAEDAAPAEAVDQAWIDERIDAAEKAIEALGEDDERRPAAMQALADLRFLPQLLSV